MEKIVYFIGAGFSAPLGLPVMNNFLIKSKDMYFKYPRKYKHFLKIFNTIDKMSIAKSYFNTDLFNIEEIFSILEMQDYLQKSKRKRTSNFRKYIADVIEYFTPKILKAEGILSLNNYGTRMFGNDEIFKIYGFFIGNILNLKIRTELNKSNPKLVRKLLYSRIDKPNAVYSIITLNYDLIFENIRQFIVENYEKEGKIGLLNLLSQENNEKSKNVCLAKLHGSIKNPLTIVPPTWNKKGTSKDLLLVWKLAHDLLEKANYIRILGYSLPPLDSYVKYLLKSAVLRSSHLKCIDVICLDQDEGVKARFDDFIKFKYYRFKNCNIIEYLKHNFDLHHKYIPTRYINFDKLEESHKKYMERI